jgi:5,10-methenyltetrahydrofolate synthetase
MPRELPSKQELRRILRQQRQMIPPAVRACQETILCQRVANLPQWRSARSVFAYLATAEEPSLAKLWQACRDKTWAFPRCAWSSKTLDWFVVDPLHLAQQTEIDKYGIPCPKPDLPHININCADVILVPALACDRRGYRLGYGGGFYDRSLAGYCGFTVGIILHQFLLEQLPHDTWDIRLSAVVSEQETLFC